MRSIPIGRVLTPEVFLPWMVSHAAYPTPFLLDEKTIRVLFVSRDSAQQGYVGWCDVSASDPTTIVGISRTAVLGPGEPGAFDDSGIGIGNVVSRKDGLYLYYMGWNQGTTVPFNNAIGLAISKDGRGDRFERPFLGPLIDRNRYDPFSLSYPFVFPCNGGWRMLYGSHRGPTYTPMHHVLCHASSNDGYDWKTDGLPELDLDEDEVAVCRPWVFDGPDGISYMLFSSNSDRYRVGCAARDDSGSWSRLQSDLVPLGEDAWSSQEVCYSGHVEAKGRHFVFYNGNGYGRTGFGVCELEF